MLVMRDPETRLSAHAVPTKGAVVEWIAQQVVRDLERLGHHGRLVIRCDQDAALKSLVSEAARMRGDAVTISKNPLLLEIHEENGFIERAVRTVEEMVTTFKLDLEGRISETLKITRKVISWLIEYAVDLVNKVQVGQNGKTSFERVQGETVQWTNPVLMSVAGKVQGGVMSKGGLKGCRWG